MLKKAKLKIAAWSITGVIGAGSLFSGIAVQNVHAQESAAVESVNESTVYSGNTEISEQINENQGFYSDASADTLQSVTVTEDNEENTPSERPEQNSTAIENDTETESSKDPVKESTTGSETQNDDNAKEFSGTGAIKDTKAVEAKKNGWVKVKGGYKYYKKGKAYTGWHKMGKAEGEKTEHYSYFGSDGIVRTGWQSMGKGTRNSYDENTAKHTCYFGKDGWLRTGWQSMGKKTKNSYDENTEKHMSYFGKDGWLRTGWQSMGKKTKNSYDENTDKHMSYFGKDGWLRTGWQSMGKKTKNSYDENTEKHMSYFGKDGWLRTGWQEMGKGTKNSYGENTEKHTSYFGKDGWLRTGNHVIDGVSYTFNSRGWLNALYENGKLFTGVKIGDVSSNFTGLGLRVMAPGIAYKNGQRFTGYINEFPETYDWIIRFTYTDSPSKIHTERWTKRSFGVPILDENPGFYVNGWGFECIINNNDRSPSLMLEANNDYYGGAKVTLKIGGDTYSANIIRDSSGDGKANIILKKNYSEGMKYTATVTYGGRSLTATYTVH